MLALVEVLHFFANEIICCKEICHQQCNLKYGFSQSMQNFM